MSDSQAALDRLALALDELHAAAHAVLKLARTQQKELEARTAEDVEWKRMPGRGKRCEISGWTRAYIDQLSKAGKVRKKKITGGVFYSGADVRRLIAEG